MQRDQTVGDCRNPGNKTRVGTGAEVAMVEAQCVLWTLLKLKQLRMNLCFFLHLEVLVRNFSLFLLL